MEPAFFRRRGNLVMKATNEIASSQKTLLAMTLHYSF
jgi:hypothetical protein